MVELPRAKRAYLGMDLSVGLSFQLVAFVVLSPYGRPETALVRNHRRIMDRRAAGYDRYPKKVMAFGGAMAMGDVVASEQAWTVIRRLGNSPRHECQLRLRRLVAQNAKGRTR